ncbi:MAG TPA: electron transfer flavoprotein subunit beta/FixA family protein [Ktedonobacteraceae bacterium]|nr:electron transfer flavoprotein subunit beta/FixA family protein [Ktedonobacteraceae bacterium]
MNIIVPVKQVPDLVEELEINSDGTDLERDMIKYKMNEWDESALEEALQLKEMHGGTVTVLTVASGDVEVDETLYTCVAKGADRVVKIVGNFEEHYDSHTAARALAEAIRGMSYDLILTGVQAADDLDGQVGVLLATYLGIPHISVVSGIEAEPVSRTATVHQEYAGGIMATFEVDLPVVLGVQAARAIPRYAPVSRVRQAMKSAHIEEIEATTPVGAGISVRRMFKPESTEHAEMIEGDAGEIVNRVMEILRERGLWRA